MKINAEKYFENVIGYKINNAHFELGSNLHIDNYFYVKRLFYNSFYTNRFAFLIVNQILEAHEELLQGFAKPGKNRRDPDITLLGFENYSDLLVSNVRKMLNDHFRIKYQLNHDIFNHDIYTKDALFLKNPNKIAKHIIQIFPISTTFSTSVRIQAEIRELALEQKLGCKNPVFLNPVINCMVIANQLPAYNQEFSEQDIEYDYGWRSVSLHNRTIILEVIDKQYIEVSNLPEINAAPHYILQSYMIPQVSGWKKINECLACYPDEPGDEKCLIETKSTPVTPNLIFRYPLTFDHADKTNIFHYFNIKRNKNTEESLVYRRHFKRYDNHYIYYIRIGRFLQENLASVKTWLRTLHKKVFLQYVDEPIVIVTPTVGSNSGFVNLFNDIIFSDTATIIQYNPKEEYLENFILFYADTIAKAKKVIFVDDAIATTQTILDINFFIKHVRKNNYGLDYCVTLINRVGYHNYLQLIDKLSESDTGTAGDRILCYLNLNVAPLSHGTKYPYLALMERFHELSTKSVLDSMKMHFRQRARDFRPVDLTTEYDFGTSQHTKSLLQFILMHEFGNLFKTDGKKYIHEPVIEFAFSKPTNSSFTFVLNFFEKDKAGGALPTFKSYYPKYAGEIKNGLFKVCTSEPYLHNKHIKEAVFKWVLSDLIEMVRSINQEGAVTERFFQCKNQTDEPVAFSPYQRFRFLLKRGAKLKMNYIYDIATLKAIRKVLDGIGQYKMNWAYEYTQGMVFKPIEKSASSKEIFPIGFITYYVALLQELIIEHESKALRVVINIKKIIDENIDQPHQWTLKNSYNDHFIYLLRMLVLENTFIFHTSSEKFLSKIKKDISFSDVNRDGFMDKLQSAMDTYPFDYTKKMLSRFLFKGKTVEFRSDEGSLEAFKKMMVLKALLKNDIADHRNLSNTPIEVKLREILKIACEILDIRNGGAMFAVKYKNMVSPSTGDDIHIVANYTSTTQSGFSGYEFTKDSLLFKIFDGVTEQNSKNSISSLELTMDDRYNYHFRQAKDIDRKNLRKLFEFEGELFKKLFYLRITRFANSPDNNDIEIIPQAVMCFFDEKIPQGEYARAREAFDHADTPPLEIFNSECPPKRNVYQRLDPKRIRQLLLLRNDLSSFIKHHFDNDSLRAYIEQLKNKQVYQSLNHGTSTYEKMIRHYIVLLNNEQQAGNIKQHTKYLSALFNYLINKLHLLSAANKLFESSGEQYDFEELTLSRVISEFDRQHSVVLLMHQPHFRMVSDETKFTLDTSDISNSAGLQTLYIFRDLLPEMVFEILYNIKKHCVNLRSIQINAGQVPLKISLSLCYVKEQTYLKVTNNFSFVTPEYAENLNNKLIKSDSLDGLNLIYNIIYKTTGIRLFVDAENGNFSVHIPVYRSVMK